MKTTDLVLLDLFSGTGGFPLGLQQAGFTFKKHYFSEIDKYAIANYRYNFKHSIYAGSVQEIKKGKIESPDLVCFGFPCQDVSLAGHRKGLQGERTSLYFEALRIVEEFRPRIFVFENVKGLFSTNEGRDFEEVIKAAADLGFYNSQWQLLNSSWVLPQNRERIYFVGCLRTERPPEIFPISEESFGHQKGHEKKAQGQIAPTIDTGVGNGGNYSPYVVEDAKKANYDQYDPNNTNNKSVNNRVYHPKGLAPTQTANHDQTKIYSNNGTQIRKLTPVECERLQGFPDGWTQFGLFDGQKKELSDSQRYKLMGNAVSVAVVKMVGLRMMGKSLVELERGLKSPKGTKQLNGDKALAGPDDTCPSYLRARLRYIERVTKGHEDKESMEYRLIRNYGYILDEDSKIGDICSIQTFENLKDYPPLDFMELTRYNTWFALHPEKVCGKEFITTSRNFPISVKGTKEDIINTIHKFISPDPQWEDYRERQKRKLKLKAKALRLKLLFLGFKF